MNDVIDTKYFSIKRLSDSVIEGVVDIDGLHVDFNSGERVHENRVYRHESNLYVVMIVTKVKNNDICLAVTMIDDKNQRVSCRELGWSKMTVYEELIGSIEEKFAKDNCYIYNIVPGRLYNVYFQNRRD